MTIRTRLLLSAASLAVMTTSALPAFAQVSVEEIVVTTRKRAENLQDVPMSVSALSADSIERQGITNVADVAKLSSSITFDKGFAPTDNRISIRGLSPTRGRPNAAILVDGIDLTSESINFAGGGAIVTQRLLDIERVEIVKGPQSALYGRSAFGGAIQYITKKPGDAFEAKASIDAGSAGRYALQGSASTPVTDTFGIGVGANYWTEDGFYKHPVTGQNMGGGEGWGLTGVGNFKPSDDFTVTARVAYSDDSYADRAVSYVRHNQTLRAPAAGCPAVFSTSACTNVNFVYPVYFGAVPNGANLQPTSGLDPRTNKIYPDSPRKTVVASLVASWDIAAGTISSLTGYVHTKDSFLNEGDYDSVFVNGKDVSTRAEEFDFRDRTSQFSQELRYATKLDGPVQVTVGGLYWQERASQLGNSKFIDTFGFGSAAALFPLVSPRLYETGRNTNHWSGYAMGEWKITDDVKATVEGRYAHESQTVIGAICTLKPCVDTLGAAFGGPQPFFGPSQADFGDIFTNLFGTRTTIRLPPVASLASHTSENYFAPKFSLEWRIDTNKLLYASVAKGVKPGGTSTVTAGTFFDAYGDGTPRAFQFKAEKLWAYEIGSKNTWLDGRLITNVAAFYQQYSNKQVSTQDLNNVGQAVGVIKNAGKARIYGLEFDGAVKATENLELTASYSYLNAKYTSFVINTTSAIEALRVGNCTVVRVGTSNQCSVDMSGHAMERIPRSALVLGANFHAPLAGEIQGFIEGDAKYQSKRFIDEENTKTLPSYWLANARVGVETNRWRVAFYVDNMFNDLKVKSASAAPGDVDATLTAGGFANTFSPSDGLLVNLPDPRTWGVRASIKF